MVELFSPRGEAELLLLKSILDDAGILYHVQNDAFGSLVAGPNIESYNRKTIFVPETQAAEATALVSEFLARTGTAPPPTTAPPVSGLAAWLERLLDRWLASRRPARRPRHLRLVKGALRNGPTPPATPSEPDATGQQ